MNDQLELIEAERIVLTELLEGARMELSEGILHAQSLMLRTSFDCRLRIVRRLFERFQSIVPTLPTQG
jgi:hypothetical protein